MNARPAPLGGRAITTPSRESARALLHHVNGLGQVHQLALRRPHNRMAETTQSLLRLRDDLIWRQIGDEVMVLDTATSEYLSVNASGAVLWPLLAEGCRPDDLQRALVERFDIDQETAEQDTQRFLSSLEEIKAFVAPAP
jgi:hypothetical protein